MSISERRWPPISYPEGCLSASCSKHQLQSLAPTAVPLLLYIIEPLGDLYVMIGPEYIGLERDKRAWPGIEPGTSSKRQNTLRRNHTTRPPGHIHLGATTVLYPQDSCWRLTHASVAP